MIFVDYTQLVVASSLAFGSDMDKGKDKSKIIDIIRHTTLNTILSIKKKYGKEYGEIILCGDGSKNWRKTYYPYYKQHRKGDREESKTDWNTIFTFASTLFEELKQVFPYYTVKLDRAEGDDVIGVLTKYITENETVMQGLVETEQSILIYSNDGDYKQLHKFKNVRQWNPIIKKFVERAEPEFLLEKVIRGDAGDGVPNVLTEDDFFVNGTGRQKSITTKVIERFKSGNLTTIEARNFQRNKTLIDFDCIPEDIQQEIIEAYKNNKPVKDKNAIMNYLIANRCRVLLDHLQEF
jgi:5'-3' exonuclease